MDNHIHFGRFDERSCRFYQPKGWDSYRIALDALAVTCPACHAVDHIGRCTSCGCEIAPEGYCGCEPGSLDGGDLAAYEQRCQARAAIAQAKGESHG